MPLTAQDLMQAQMNFILNELRGETLTQHLASEAEAYCDLLEQLPIQTLIPSALTIGWIERNVLSYAPTEVMREQVAMLVELGLNNPSHQQMPMRQLINRQIYDLMVERLIARPALRQEIIQTALRNPIYVNLMSDVLYRSIADYLMTENPLARNVPGVSSLLKVGKGVIGRMGSLEQTAQQAIKTYIARNISATVDYSERLLMKSMSETRLRAFADSLWPHLEAYELGQATRHLEIQGLSTLAVVFWNQIRSTEFMRQQVSYLVNAWYQQHGERPGMEVLEELGITRKQLVREVVAIGEPLMTAWVDSGHIEQRLRGHLQRFFDEPATQALLARE